MQHQPKHSASASHSHPTWRYTHSTKRRASKRPHPQKRSDLGSDDEWQLIMGSDSDVDEPEAPVANPPATHSSPHVEPDKDPLAVQWHDTDEEHFVDDVKQCKIPSVPESSSAHLPANQPVYTSPNHLSPDCVATAFDTTHHTSKPHTRPVPPSSIDNAPPKTRAPESHQHHADVHPEADADADASADDHPVIIPGYRGVSSRAAVANHAAISLHGTAKRTSTWGDRPRGNPVPLLSSHPAADSNSGQSSPGLIRTPTRIESDSGPSSHGGSAGSGNALLVSKPISLDTEDGFHHVGSKPKFFAAQSPSKSSAQSPSQDATHPTLPNLFTSSVPSSEEIAGSGKTNTRKSSGIRLTLRDSRARLSAARLSGSKRQHRRPSPAGDASLQGGMTDNSASVFESERDPSVLPPLRNNPHYLLGGSSATRTLSNHQRLSTRSDGAYPRRNSELLQGGALNGRPLSTPSHTSSANFDSPITSQATVTTLSAGSAYPSSTGTSALPIHSRRKGFHLGSTPTKDLSFLDCVVEILKGTNAARRKSFMNVHEGQIWLTPDMQAVKYRMGKKGQVPETHTLTLARVRKLKGVERELSIEMIDQKKPIEFLFQSRERADTWLSALCCLVPSHATVKSRHRKLELRETYDPLADTWNGKEVAFKKKLNQFILLGSIGRGSFAKVKLALSEEDRQFYAVKVLPKTVERKNRLGLPLDGSIQNTEATSQLTIADVNEIVVMKALDHENVMKMKGVFDDAEDNRLYIVMEFLAKGPIMNSKLLTGAKTITENQARSAFVDVLRGLHYLHSSNIIHRDIKPDNLLQAGDGTVKISDFGAAVLYAGDDRREADDSQAHQGIVGTPAFSAPELCLSEKSPPRPARGYAADIWSLGATLFYMVYGRVPFYAEGMFEMFDAICTREVVFPDTPRVSKNLQILIRQMLQKLPEDRATIATISQSPWLTENEEAAPKLAKIRSALLQQSNGSSEERRRGLPSNRQVP